MHASTLNGLRYDIERELEGARFESDTQMTLGPLSLALVRRLAAAGETEDEDLALLKDVRKVEIALYETLSLPAPAGGRFTIPAHDAFRSQGWKTLATVDEGDGGTWVLYRNGRDGSIRELLVGSLDRNELELVRIRGDVEGMMERLRDENRLDLPGIVHTDLDPEEGEPALTVEADG
jgi:hypothetical protein